MKRGLLLTVILAVVLVLGSVGSTIRTSQAAANPYAGHYPVLAYAEIITDPLSGEAGRVEYFRQDLGNKNLTSDYVYGDPRRMAFNGGNPGVTYGVFPDNLSADAGLANQEYWLHESVNIWDYQTCSNLTLSENDIPSGLFGVVETYFWTGVIVEDWRADLTQVGFLSAAEFPYFAASPNVLGVTFTLVWADANGLTDIDGNGKTDVAFREIYYNDQFEWVDNGVLGNRGDGVYDFPSVAIHEVGHGFSQAHFGSIGVKDGKLFASPDAIMNAIYGGIQRTLLGTDVGGHCSNWANWPVN